MLKSKINFSLAIAMLFTVVVQSLGQTVPPATREQEDKLIAVLNSDAPRKAKADACRQLAVIGTKAAVKPLAALLGDEKLSHMARYGLETIPDASVDVALRNALGKVKGQLLVGVIGSIGVRRDARAVGQLSKMLQAPDRQVVQAAAKALGKIANPTAVKELQVALANAPKTNQLIICEGLFRCAELFTAQGRSNKAIAIYDQLQTLKAPHQVRAGALRGSITARRKNGLPLLRKYLRSDDYILFSAAVQASQELAGTEVTQALTAVLNQLPPDNQILVLQALGNRHDVSAIPAVIKVAKDSKTASRVTALKVLGQLANVSVVSTLVAATVDSNAEIAKTARFTLIGLPSNKEIDAAILTMAEKGKFNARLVAIDVVAQRRIATGHQLLLKVANDPDKRIRIAAIEALRETVKTSDLTNLLAMLVNRRDAEEIRAVEKVVKAVCGKFNDKKECTRSLLLTLQKARVAESKCALLRLLPMTGGTDALQAVRAATRNANLQVRKTAIGSLCEWPTVDVAPDLLNLAKSLPDVPGRIGPLRSYINLIQDKSLSTEKKLAMSRQAAALVQRDQEKKLLLGVLGKVPTIEALSMAMAYLDNTATKNEACIAVVAISENIVKQKPNEVTEALNKVIKATDNKNVTKRAKEILDTAKKSAKK